MRTRMASLARALSVLGRTRSVAADPGPGPVLPAGLTRCWSSMILPNSCRFVPGAARRVCGPADCSCPAPRSAAGRDLRQHQLRWMLAGVPDRVDGGHRLGRGRDIPAGIEVAIVLGK